MFGAPSYIGRGKIGKFSRKCLLLLAASILTRRDRLCLAYEKPTFWRSPASGGSALAPAMEASSNNYPLGTQALVAKPYKKCHCRWVA